MLTICSSNHLERLADAIACKLSQHPQGPFTPETVVVQSLGMRRWLSFALAERMGVAMNVAFPFPAHLVERAFNAILPNTPVSPIYRRDVLPWRIHALLPSVWDDAAFGELKRYGGDDPVKRWHLCVQIAAVFDRYLAYRPLLLRRWDAGEDDPEHPWQSQLWRRIQAAHPAALAQGLATAPAWANAALPARISVFGVSTLPPFYVELLGELGRRTEVHLYLLSPTREYWGDLRSQKEINRYRRWCERRQQPFAEQHMAGGHPLLASFGKVGREFHESVLDLTPGKEVTEFAEPSGSDLLAQVQRSILSLEVPGDRPLIDRDDRSLQVHNCHSPLRELEVLHDRLLDLFQRHRDLEPRDVLVSVPDITTYAPLIDAVFGAPENEAVRFPYSVADREARSQNSVTDAFLRLLELAGSRFTASEVVSLLESPPFAARFGISNSEVPLLRRWTAESGIRWGMNADHRERLDFPPWLENTWQFGLDRLLLGAALPENGTELFEGILPFGDAEGSKADVLGRFATACAAIFGCAKRLTESARRPQEWVEILRETLAAVCSSDGDFADAWRETSLALETLETSTKLAENAVELPFVVVRDYAEGILAEIDRANEFLRGGITFCSLKPMRSIPHRVVAVLGLNDAAFPRTARPPSFDLMASHPQAGDRTIRDDDRYLFLESILSARDVLYLSYCGQSSKDDSASPPSVLVVELLDYLERVYALRGGGSLREHLTIAHSLQPFHPSYFRGDAQMFSYSTHALEVARVAANPRGDLPAFVTPDTKQAPDGGELTLDLLSRCMVHPTKFFAQEALSMRLPFKEESLEDTEPIRFEGLESYGLKQGLVEHALQGEDPITRFAATKASGTLPHGFAGELAFSEAADVARTVAEMARHHAPGPANLPRMGEVAVGKWRIRGHILGERGGMLLRVRAASIGPKDLLRAWCAHLFACAAEPGSNHRTLIVGKDDCRILVAVKHPVAELERLIHYYAQAHTRPLPFFPETSQAFAKGTLLPGRSKTAPLEAAEKAWRGSGNDQYGRAEAEDEWNAIVWRPPAQPLNPEFAELACHVFRPLFDHLEERTE